MKINYNILWFEDVKSSFDAKKKIVKEIVEDLGFNFPEPQNEKNGQNIDKINFVKFDLIIVDLNLGREKGSNLIEKIRQMDVYTEVIFYSSSGEQAVREEIKNHDIDGAYCTGRDNEDFEEKVKKVILTTIKKVQDVNNMRGLVMAEVSDLDQKMLSIIKEYFDSLTDVDKEEFMKYVKEKVINSLNGKIKRIDKYKHTEFHKFIEHPNFESFSKWMVASHIVKKVKVNVSKEAEILTSYTSEVIDTRNILAHIIEEVTDDGIIFKGKKGFIFGDESCVTIRKTLKKHSSNFEQIYQKIKK